MPRNGSGSYSLPEAPFVPLTTISSTAVNSDFSDIATAITASLARDGQGGMTDVLPLNVAGFTYVVDPNTGMYRTAADTQAIKCGGTDIVQVTATGVNVVGTLTKSGVAVDTFPAGTVMLFRQTAAPIGWTKETINNDAAIRIVSGTASTGGTAGFTTALSSRTITQANLPSYNLSTGSITATLSSISLWSRGGSYGAGTIATIVDSANQTSGPTSAALSAATITIGGSIPSGGSGTAMDFAVKYVDVISATKD